MRLRGWRTEGGSDHGGKFSIEKIRIQCCIKDGGTGVMVNNQLHQQYFSAALDGFLL